MWLKEVMTEHFRKNRTSHDHSYFRASGMGYCYRMRMYELLGKKGNDNTDDEIETFEIGHMFHNYIQDILQKEGVMLEAEQEIFDKHNAFAGHSDGIYKYKGKIYLVDFKTIKEYAFQSYLDKPKMTHCLQITWYWLQYREKYPIDHVQIIYVSKDLSNGFKFKIFDINPNDYIIDVYKEMRELQKYKDTKKIPPKEPKEDWQCRFCKYIDICKPKAKTKTKKLKGVDSDDKK